MNASDDVRILVDLSLGALGFSGIPQETRLLFKALTQIAGLETSGLLCPVGNDPGPSPPCASASTARQLEYQARVLHRLARPVNQSLWWSRLHALWSLVREAGGLLSPREPLRPLDREWFWDVVWRRWLADSLAPDDRSLSCQPVTHCAVNRHSLNLRTLLGLPGPRLDTRGYDFALFHEARALRVAPTTCKLVRHYDLIPVVRPDLVTSERQIRVQAQGVRACLNDSIFVCISEASRHDLLRLHPEAAERAVTIPCTLGDGFYPDAQANLVPGIVAQRSRLPLKRRFKQDTPYLLMVCTIEPRKNHLALIRAMEQVLARRETDLRLILVGGLGWDHDEIVRSMGPLQRRQRLIHLERVPLDDLRVLYSQARAVAFPSLYEGFGYSPLEAMRCGTPVVASDIAVHREVYGEAFYPCDPYRVSSIARAIEHLCLDASETERATLTARGFVRVRRYQVGAIASQWSALLEELRRQGIRHNVRDARLADFNDHLRDLGEQAERAERTPDHLHPPVTGAA